jgi:hypothetical protein
MKLVKYQSHTAHPKNYSASSSLDRASDSALETA